MDMEVEWDIWEIILILIPISLFFGSLQTLLFFNMRIDWAFIITLFGTIPVFYFLLWAHEKISEPEKKVDFESMQISSNKDDESSFSLFGKKETCDTCGSVLVYKEDYESYYCLECSEYKGKQ